MIAYRKDKGTGKNFTMKKVLLSDIARECGLSVSTVSRVLSGDDSRRIRQETRDLIYRKAEELGYIRERISRLSKKESIRVATLFLSDHESLPSPFFSEIIDGIKTASASYPDADISFTLLSLYDSDFYRNFSEGGFDIAIILGRVRKDVLRRIRESGVQLIYAGLNGIEGMDQVISDAKSGCAAAVPTLGITALEAVLNTELCRTEKGTEVLPYTFRRSSSPAVVRPVAELSVFPTLPAA